MLKINFKKNIPPVLSAVIVSFFAVFILNVVWAWTGPSVAAPGENIDAPVNVGSEDQIKDGALGVGAFTSFGDALFNGNISLTGTLQSGSVPWARITGFSGDTTPDTIADDGIINDSEVSDSITINNGVLYALTSGNVGIGTTNPNSKLTVFGNGTASIGWGDNSLLGWLTWSGPDPAIRSWTNLRLGAGGNNDFMIISSNGNVGIGTLTPGAKKESGWPETKLDIQGGFLRVSDQAGGSYQNTAFMEGGNEVSYFGSVGTQRASFGNSDNWETITVDNGNVGIGKTNPSFKLDVNGQIRGTGFLTNDIKNDNNYPLNVYSDRSLWLSAKQSLLLLGSDEINFSTGAGAGTVKMNITANGNVGIGKTTPSFKLDVNGGIGAADSSISSLGKLDQYLESTNNKLRFTGFYNNPYLELIVSGKPTPYGITVWPSSREVKTNISKIEVDTSKIYDLAPVSFYYKNDEEKTTKNFGLIAEEVEKYFPQLIMRSNQNNKIIGLDYGKFSVLLLSELQKLKEENKILNEKVERLLETE